MLYKSLKAATYHSMFPWTHAFFGHQQTIPRRYKPIPWQWNIYPHHKDMTLQCCTTFTLYFWVSRNHLSFSPIKTMPPSHVFYLLQEHPWGWQPVWTQASFQDKSGASHVCHFMLGTCSTIVAETIEEFYNLRHVVLLWHLPHALSWFGGTMRNQSANKTKLQPTHLQHPHWMPRHSLRALTNSLASWSWCLNTGSRHKRWYAQNGFL